MNCRYEGDTSARIEDLKKQLYRYVPVDIHGEVHPGFPFPSPDS